jgi:hypothetical protein
MSHEHAACEHIFLGRQVVPEREREAAPLDVHRSIVNEHVYMCGRTGSGKTALGILSLLHQLARPWREVQRDRGGKVKRDKTTNEPQFHRRERPPIVILDLKGDASLFNSARRIAQDNGYPFRFFTLDSGKSSCVFDPFRELASRTPAEMCEVFILALNLFHGEQYGASYFSRQHRHYLREALKKAKDNKTPITTFADLYDYLQRLYTGPGKHEATELMMVVAAMAEYPQLVAGKTKDDFLIDMAQVLQQRQLVYFWLPADVAAMSVREVGKLALYALNVAARTRSERGERIQTYVFVDEFQEIAGENLKQILNQSRSRGLSYILTNQQYPDLQTNDTDLGPVALNNPRLVLAFSPSGDGELCKWLERRSGLMLKSRISSSEGTSTDPYGFVSTSVSTTSRLVEVPRADAELFRKVSNDPQGTLAVITQDQGLSDTGGIPTWVRMPFTIEPGEHQRRSSFTGKFSWPDAPRPTPPQTPRPATASAQTKAEYNEKLQQIFDAPPQFQRQARPKRKRP